MKRIIPKLIVMILTVLISFTKVEAVEAVDLPEEVQQMCIEAGLEFDFCPTMLMAICWQESRGLLPNLTQIGYKEWFREGIEYTGDDDIENQRNNIRICAYYMSKWGKEYKNIEVSLTGWNRGIENSVAINGKSGYATSVIKKAKEYERKWNYGWNSND